MRLEGAEIYVSGNKKPSACKACGGQIETAGQTGKTTDKTGFVRVYRCESCGRCYLRWRKWKN